MTAGTRPITSGREALQLLTFKHAKGRVVEAHFHRLARRVVNKLQECLVVIKGRVKITIYNNRGESFETIYLNTGQAIIFLSGGHKVEILKDAEIYEIKNGPYYDDKVFINH